MVVTGADADGIDARSNAAITINHFGDIDASAGRDGIDAHSFRFRHPGSTSPPQASSRADLGIVRRVTTGLAR